MFDNSGYTPKDLVFGDEGRKRLIDGIKKIAAAVKSTLGPGGNTVLIESPNHTHSITVTKDGVTVAKAVDLFDPVENLAVRMMKEAAERTATSAGDGTTTSIILTEAMVIEGTRLLTPDVNRTEVLRHLSVMCNEVVSQLTSKAKKVTNAMLVDVATISANNDKELGKIIAELYRAVGRTGIVTVEKSQTSETYSETTMGLQFARGYLSNLFVNDHKKDECVFEDVMVLVADTEISNILQIEAILKPIISENKKLLIIAPCGVNVVNTIAANVVKGNVKACVVPPPNFGYKQHELMQDIALSVGATYFSEKTGDDLSLMNYSDLGHAAKVIVSADKTIILKSNARVKADAVEERVKQLWMAHAIAKRKSDKDFLLERIASLTGGIGVIYVGGNTDLEQKELYDRVDDAVCAVRSALEEGILPGAGKALYEIDHTRLLGDGENHDQNIAWHIMDAALEAPIKQILANVGLDFNEVYERYTPEGYDMVPDGHGYNVKTGEFGDLIKMGVVDPLKVTRSALQNAVSVASTILSTNAIITMGRSFEIANKLIG
jgi:chaperonin GroEL